MHMARSERDLAAASLREECHRRFNLHRKTRFPAPSVRLVGDSYRALPMVLQSPLSASFGRVARHSEPEILLQEHCCLDCQQRSYLVTAHTCER